MLVHMVPRSSAIQARRGSDFRFGREMEPHESATCGFIMQCMGNRDVIMVSRKPGRFRISCFMKQLMIAGIRFYQKYLSPLKSTRCPYIPSCSAYGLEAIQKYGAWKGGWMALWRIMRCNPFSHGGYDPVP